MTTPRRDPTEGEGAGEDLGRDPGGSGHPAQPEPVAGLGPSGGCPSRDPAALSEEELEAACLASWEVARPAIGREYLSGGDPGPWHEQPDFGRNLTRQELRAAFEAVARLRKHPPPPTTEAQTPEAHEAKP